MRFLEHNALPVCWASEEMSPWSATPAREMAAIIQRFLQMQLEGSLSSTARVFPAPAPHLQ